MGYNYKLVSINGVLSTIAAVLSGILQGSVLGPLLFIIIVNDMPEVMTSNILMFADDTKILLEVQKDTGHTTVQQDLNELQRWCCPLPLHFNTEKC